MALERGRRLYLLFEAGGARYGVDATAVMEIATPDPTGNSIRGFHELKDLSQVLGGAPERRPGMAIVLDTSPTFAMRIGRIIDIADISGATSFMLPPIAAGSPAGVIRGAFMFDGKLFLELNPEPLPKVSTLPSRTAPTEALTAPPDKALVFTSNDQQLGIWLPLVLQVVNSTEAFCPLPAEQGRVSGLFPHAQVLWPIFLPPVRQQRSPTRETLFVLTEVGGQNVGISASGTLGFFSNFQPTDTPGEFRCEGLPAPTLFLDYQRMFG